MCIALLAALCLSMTAAEPHRVQDEPFAVIVNPATPVVDISLSELRAIFMGDKQYWPNRKRITLLLSGSGTTARSIVLKHLYRMSESEYRRHWVARIFRGDNPVAPQVVRDAQLRRQLVATLPGAVTLIPLAAVDSTVKVLRVDGRAPTHQHYPLIP